MKSSAKKIELASVDDLFSTEESRQDEQLEKIQEQFPRWDIAKIIGLHLKSTVLWGSIYMLNEKIIKWF